jgi:plasmid segregation protein ParM
MNTKKKEFCVGLDIGYSNLKLTHGWAGENPVSTLRPSGAAPLDRMGESFRGGDLNAVRVNVDGEQFVAGVTPDRAEMWSRELHEEYPTTKSYRALFHAGLLLTEQSEIDMLVTGLPVSQYFNTDMRKRLVGQMKGEHQVTPKRTIKINDVKVVPQPIGGYIDYVWGLENPVEMDDMRVMVLDPGFFSVDWVMVAGGELRKGSSGTSLEASSVILDEVAKMIASDFGGQVSRERLENAIRNGANEINVFGEKVSFKHFIEQSCNKIGPVVMTKLRESMRKENASADMLLLVGGGASFFENAVKEAFPKHKIIAAQESVYANSRGFWRFGGTGT